MRQPYVIRFAESGHQANLTDPGPGILFAVEQADTVFYVGCLMSGSAAAGFRDLNPVQIEAVLVAAGLDEIERRLDAGIYPPDEKDKIDEVLFSSEQFDELEAIVERDKHRVFREDSSAAGSVRQLLRTEMSELRRHSAPAARYPTGESSVPT